MLKNNDLRVLQVLFSDLSRKPSVLEVAKRLKQHYFQTYRSVKSLEKEKLVRINHMGNNNQLELDFSRYHNEYAVVEIERVEDITKNVYLKIVTDNVIKIDKQFICLLFGSYSAGKHKSSSDIDLLFIIPEEYNYESFERTVKKQFAPYNCDINITTEKGLLEMWSRPNKFNLGNEILKNHIILTGTERFIQLLMVHNAE